MDALKSSRKYVFLSLIALLLHPWLLVASVSRASGDFEVYCDGVGIFLAKIDGMPAPRKLVSFSRIGFPPGTMGGYWGQGKWSDVYVLRNGCVPDGKCESIADGSVWIDASETSDAGHMPPKRISGKYEINLNGKHLEGPFIARRHVSKHPLRLCM